MSKLRNHELARIVEQARVAKRTDSEVFLEAMRQSFPLPDRTESLSRAMVAAKGGKLKRREQPLTGRLYETARIRYAVPTGPNAEAVKALNQELEAHKEGPEAVKARLCMAAGVNPRTMELTPKEIYRRHGRDVARAITKIVRGK